jgi:flagellar P-ring protein FlgI
MGMGRPIGDTKMNTKQRLNGLLAALFALTATLAPLAEASAAAARIKDIVDIEGIRDNQLVGYGLVVGLNGTGDSLNNSPFTRQSLQAMLERLGVNTRGENMRTANVAAVMVTGNLPAFATQGSRMDVNVAALGDAKSLQGGTLLVTPLLGADGEVYAIAQGSVTINGFSAQGDAASIVSGVPTTGRISSGGLIEREIGFVLGAQRTLRLALRNPDLTTARRIALSINDFIGSPAATPEDPATIRIHLPHRFNGNIVDLLTDIEQLVVETDLPAKIIIDENSGIIVMGADVRVSTVAVAQSNLTVTIAESPIVSQPDPFSLGRTVELPRTDLEVSTTDSNLAVVTESVTLQQLVDGLNALGISPRDLIAILQAIKASGALQAEIQVL